MPTNSSTTWYICSCPGLAPANWLKLAPRKWRHAFRDSPPRRSSTIRLLWATPPITCRGVRSIGAKTAGTLLQKYGDIEGILEHAFELPARQQKALAEDGEQLAQSRELVTIVRDMEITLDPAESELDNYDQDQVLALFQELSFRSLLDRPAKTSRRSHRAGHALWRDCN